MYIYNAITLNKREIDRVHKNELYIAIILNKREIDRVYKTEMYTATVGIKQKAVDRIKTALRFWLNATRITRE